MPEFDLIDRLQDRIAAPLSGRGAACAVGIGDDGAVLDVPAGRQLVVCTDTLNDGVHFPRDTAPRALGHKALAVNLSDLAAMGAEPAWFFLNLSLPREDAAWLDGFADGMGDLASDAGILLAGGDTTSGPLSVTVTALGLVEPGRALLRSGAGAGDRIVVSGTPGRAACALEMIGRGEDPGVGLRAALDRPRPRLALGRALRGLATSCIDVSDGLLADLGHILASSALGAEVFVDALPADEALASLEPAHRWSLQLAGGDDYELCFTIGSEDERRLSVLAAELGLALTVIGRVTTGGDLRVLQPGGETFVPDRVGYQHFSGAPVGGRP
ncbi:MAG: thiamine-phosphate kinase [Xanthomonadales bacterium]